jgi:hypothetical protein
MSLAFRIRMKAEDTFLFDLTIQEEMDLELEKIVLGVQRGLSIQKH